MSVQVEKKEHNMAVLTVEVPAEEFDAAIEKAYQKQRGRIAVPGFRKGHAPRKMIEKMYGAGVFYEEAANILLPEAYDKAAQECGETVVSRPDISVTQIESGKPFIFTAEVALKPAVELGQYKGVEIAKEDVTVTDEDVDRAIDEEREKNSRMIDVDDRAVENGDRIRLNFDGYVDGEAFEGGKAEDYELTVGSGSFIPGFEEQIVGHGIGEDFDVNVTFPEDYHAENLKGKEAVFKCRVNGISVKELPELNDDFAQDVSEFDTLEEYRADVRTTLLKDKNEKAASSRELHAVDAAVANATIDIPDAMVNEQARRLLNDFAQRIQTQGITMEQYMQFTGMDVDKMTEQMKPEALRRIRNSLVLEAVAEAEKIEISQEKLDEELTRMADQYKMTKDKLEEALGEEAIEQMRGDMAVQAAADLIRDTAVEVDKPETEEAEEAAPQE